VDWQTIHCATRTRYHTQAVQVSSLAATRRKARMTVSQAIGLCPTLRLIEPDPGPLRRALLESALVTHDVSPVVEPAELVSHTWG